MIMNLDTQPDEGAAHSNNDGIELTPVGAAATAKKSNHNQICIHDNDYDEDGESVVGDIYCRSSAGGSSQGIDEGANGEREVDDGASF